MPARATTREIPDRMRRLCCAIIDAVAEDASPGSVCVYDRDAIVSASPALRIGPHDPALGDTLLALEFAAEGPSHAVLVGIVASSTMSGVGLSEEVRKALPEAAELVVAILKERGVVLEKQMTAAGILWWWSEEMTE
jgi:hydrogenase maturation protease